MDGPQPKRSGAVPALPYFSQGEPPLGQKVTLTQSYAAWRIVLSFFVSVVGSITTLELLLRRTNAGGWYNAVLLVGAGCAFGGGTAWAMHFISESLRATPNGCLQRVSCRRVTELLPPITTDRQQRPVPSLPLTITTGTFSNRV